MSSEQLIAIIGIPIVAGLATAVTVLFRQSLRDQQNNQKCFEGILRETIQCLTTVAVLQQTTNNLLVEVKDTILLCKARGEHE